MSQVIIARDGIYCKACRNRIPHEIWNKMNIERKPHCKSSITGFWNWLIFCLDNYLV